MSSAPVHNVQPPKTDPIAVIGFSLKFPQQATSSVNFWDMLMEKKSAMTEVPKDRFNTVAFGRPGNSKPGMTYTNEGHFLKDDIAAFDAAFFSMTPAEVECMEPMQRFLLETTYEAFENAGVKMEEINGTKTSVHFGSFTKEYETILSRDTQIPQKYKAPGNAMSMLANKVSWFYNLVGPSIALDTACSSSLTALHLACQGIRCGDSVMGVVGGCNLILNPDTTIAMSNMNFLSPDGVCYSFDHRANGYSRGEGFGVLLIKPLSKALSDGDTIRAVVRATGASQDGRTPGITQPSGAAQEAMIRDTYRGLDMSETAFVEARDVLSKIHPDRFDVDSFYHPDGDHHGRTNARHSYLLDEDVYAFDASFFNINPHEADTIDIDFADITNYDVDSIPTYAATGTSACILSNRISYFFDWNGPSMTIDTACSSSLVAVDLAVQQLRSGASHVAVAAGANLILGPLPFIVESKLHMLSPTGRSRIWDEGADGYARGEGVAAVVLKTLSQALKDGDTIECIIRESGVNQDGKTVGITMPNHRAQEALIRETYKKAGLDLHLNGLSGNHTTIQPSHISHNRHNGHNGYNGNTVAALQPRLLVWSSADETGLDRFAAVYQEHILHSSPFTNDAEYLKNLAYTLSEKRSRLPWKSFVIATSTNDLVAKLVKKVGPSKGTQSIREPHLCYVFTGQGAQWYAMARELMDVPVFQHSLDLSERTFRELGCPWSLKVELLKSERDSNLDYPGYSQPICTAVQIALVQLLSSWNLTPSVVIGHSSGEIAAAFCVGGLSQASACKVAYYRGVVAASLEEIADGAMIAVGLSEAQIEPYLHSDYLQDGSLSIACFNSPQSISLSGSENRVSKLEEQLKHEGIFARKLKVNVAYHSQQMDQIAPKYRSLIEDLTAGTPLDGAPVMLSTIDGLPTSATALGSNEYWVKNLVSPVKFSQTLMQLLAMQFDRHHKLLRTSLNEGHLQIDHFLEIGPHATLQGPILDILRCGTNAARIGYSSVLIRRKPALFTAMEVAGKMFCLGFPVKVSAVNASGDDKMSSDKLPQLCMLVDLPSYPFNHSKKYWLEGRLSKGYRFRQFPPNELLGTQVPDWSLLEPRWQNFIRFVGNPWVKDHKINGDIIYPAAGMIAMAIEAARQLAEPNRKIAGFRFRDVSINRALRLPPGELGAETQFYLRPTRERMGKFLSWSSFRLCAHENGDWSEICNGFIAVEYVSDLAHLTDEKESKLAQLGYASLFSEAKKLCTNRLSSKRFYKAMSDHGLEFGPSFQSLRNIHYNDNAECVATTNLRNWLRYTEENKVQDCIIHPTALDSILQISSASLSKGTKDQTAPVMVPTLFRNIWIAAPDTSDVSDQDSENIVVYGKSILQGFRNATTSILALDAKKRTPFVVTDMDVVAVGEGHQIEARTTSKRICYYMYWRPDVDISKKDALGLYCSATSEFNPVVPNLLAEEKQYFAFCTLRDFFAKCPAEEMLQNKPHHLKFLNWAKTQLSKNLSQRGWSEKFQDSELGDLESKIEKNDPEGDFIIKSLRIFLEIMTGKADPLEMLFQTGLAQRYYEFLHKANSAFEDMRRYIDAFAHKYPDLKVLEIGAGTGASTEGILNTLTYGEEKNSETPGSIYPRFSEYTFTDISTSFLENARTKFAKFGSRMKFATLDIGSNPVEQGFNARGYDLVVAANVLHATANLRKTLKHARLLLRPGGKLVIFESTATDGLLPTMIFGLLPGWWLATEDYRTSGPEITRAKWQELISTCGFTGIDNAFPPLENERYNAMVATACETTKIHPKSKSIIFLILPNSPVQLDIARRLMQTFKKEEPFHNYAIVTNVDPDLHQFDQAICVSLLEIECSFLHHMTQQDFQFLQQLSAVSEMILWVHSAAISHENPLTSMATGLFRTLRNENARTKFIVLELPGKSSPTSVVKQIHTVLDNTILAPNDNYEPEYKEVDGALCINRVGNCPSLNNHIDQKGGLVGPKSQRLGENSSRRLKLGIASPGSLDTFRFIDNITAYQPLPHDEIEIQVKYAGLNFRDVLIALGQDSAPYLGMECSGIVVGVGKHSSDRFTVGDRVCCIQGGSLATHVRCNALLAMKIPDAIPLQTAAAIPVVYLTAYHAIMNVAQVQGGETILIHSGAGGLGQACIQLSRILGAEIFTTVGSDAKKHFLMATYDIPEDHIFSSRTPSFVTGIKRITDGRGVDVIINSLANEALKCTWDCIAPFGRFLEVGKRDIYGLGSLPMFPFSQNVSFSGVDLHKLCELKPQVVSNLLEAVMKLLDDGEISAPSPLNIYSSSVLVEAFRHLESGESQGKAVVEFGNDDIVQILPSIAPTYSFDQNATYVISGGLGGLGRSMARWMASRNAKHLILLSRSNNHSDAAKNLLVELHDLGIDVATPPCDIADKEVLRAVLESCERAGMPAIKGCIQSSMILRDSLFANMALEDFDTAVKPKVDGSWNLHSLLPKGLDFFIMLSSQSGVVGNFGQGNYASGNTYQDALARHRVELGEKAVALDLGHMRDAGYVAEREDAFNTDAFMSIYDTEFQALLDYFCDPSLPPPTNSQSQVLVGFQLPSTVKSMGLEEPYWMSSPMFRSLYQLENRSLSPASEAVLSYKDLIQSAENMAEVVDIVADALQSKLSKMLALEKKEDIDMHRLMHTYGVDSLSAVEIRTWFRNMVGVDVAIFEILGNQSIASLAATVGPKSRFISIRKVEEDE